MLLGRRADKLTYNGICDTIDKLTDVLLYFLDVHTCRRGRGVRRSFIVGSWCSVRISPCGPTHGILYSSVADPSTTIHIGLRIVSQTDMNRSMPLCRRTLTDVQSSRHLQTTGL